MSSRLFVELAYAFIPSGHGFDLVRAPCIEVDEEGIAGFSPGCPPGARRIPAVIMPALCNAHIHLLDYALAEMGEDRDLEELVALPQGLKYRALQALSVSEVSRRLERLASRLASRGTLYLGAYAELGKEGAEIITGVLKARGIGVRVLAQPVVKSYSEYRGLLELYKGVGLDTVFDISYSELVELVRMASNINGYVHVHVSETRQLRGMGDYEIVLGAKPHAAIHLTELSDEELLVLAREGIGVVFCPRSNMYHLGKLPRLSILPRLVEETLVGLGTDNAAWIPPYIEEEAAYSYLSVHASSRTSAKSIATSILLSITTSCTKLLGLWDKEYDFLGRGAVISLIPEIGWSSDPIITLVKRMASYKTLGIAPGQAASVISKLLSHSAY